MMDHTYSRNMTYKDIFLQTVQNSVRTPTKNDSFISSAISTAQTSSLLKSHPFPSTLSESQSISYFLLDCCDEEGGERIGQLPRSLRVPPSMLADASAMEDIMVTVKQLSNENRNLHFSLIGPGKELLWYVRLLSY